MGLFSRTADVPALAAERDFEGLVKALKDDDTREQATDAIAALGDPDALQPLLEMREDERPEAARNGYIGLLALGSPKAMAAVVEGLERGPSQSQALKAIELHWRGAEPAIIRASVAPLGGGPEQVDAEMLSSSSGILGRLITRIRSGEVGSDEPVATFGDLLEHPEDNVRMAAAMMLNQSLPEGGIGEPDPRMADALAEACGDEFDGVRAMAAHALRKQNDPRALKTLMSLLDGREAIAAEAIKDVRAIAETSGLPDEDGQRIIAKFEAVGSGNPMSKDLSLTVNAVRKRSRSARKVAERNRA